MPLNQNRRTAVGEDARRVLDVDLTELQQRAGGLARELGREVIWLWGEMRVQWFEMLSEGWLKLAQRKIVLFPHGIYTITYRQDRRRPGKMVALQKGERPLRRITISRNG